MNEVLDKILKAVATTLVAVAHPDPLSVINAIRADYDAGDDIFKVIKDNLDEDEHIKSLIDDVNNDKAEGVNE